MGPGRVGSPKPFPAGVERGLERVRVAAHMTEDPRPPVIWENRVRWAETDRQDVVFYGTYFTYQDETQIEFFRRIGYPYDRIEDEGWTTHIVHAELDYRAPARFDDVVVNRMRADAIGHASLSLAYLATREADDAVLVEGNVTHAFVDEASGDPIRVPQAFRDAVVAFQHAPPDPV